VHHEMMRLVSLSFRFRSRMAVVLSMLENKLNMLLSQLVRPALCF
jgi:hypothetical protein